ncbi:hypothetical protein [Stappia sp.]|uniref:hypothetical protein n=1 Tax=Stappia sp. TaxID=1870903 RepID=UPI0032D93550
MIDTDTRPDHTNIVRIRETIVEARRLAKESDLAMLDYILEMALIELYEEAKR